MVTQPAVQVSRGTLIALVAALAVSVLAVAFFVGRESGRVRPTPAPQPAVTVPPPVGAAEPPTLAPYSAPAAPVDASVPGTSVAVAAPFTPPTTYTSVAPPSRDALRESVATYFRNVDAIQSRAKSWNDPEALARTLLEQGSRGDMSGFDGLAAANRKVREDLRALDVPEPCQEHHRATLALVEESVSMLERVKSQFQGSDSSSLAAIAGSGQELERKAKEVDAQAAEIKRRFGL
jgi:hypothetical protein